jgi:hypothetical protein
MGSFQDGYLGHELLCTLHHLQEHGNHDLFSLHDIVQLPVEEKFLH